jgi:hypothetical protein
VKGNRGVDDIFAIEQESTVHKARLIMQNVMPPKLADRMNVASIWHKKTGCN